MQFFSPALEDLDEQRHVEMSSAARDQNKNRSGEKYKLQKNDTMNYSIEGDSSSNGRQYDVFSSVVRGQKGGSYDSSQDQKQEGGGDKNQQQQQRRTIPSSNIGGINHGGATAGNRSKAISSVGDGNVNDNDQQSSTEYQEDSLNDVLFDIADDFLS
ncbi:hypothetical protein BDB00DRAFT_932727 [Zychaea mexicana]|uniref:uncharacterized protein n=1 Tax=Zychaea mexicana TaxID=64656 RepID=UPI0022FECB5B|nr:uncharacterized protein BDB00DRAFT_932727 [Zychaea mexicana]KAI9488445.1 hypothetical protein BDB00DRAFT_932727 [Zychaea mexicana]